MPVMSKVSARSWSGNFFASDANLPKRNCLIPKAPNWFSIVTLSICKKVVRNEYSFKSTVMMSVVEFMHAFCMTVDLT